jgi:hypothetical protein
VALAEGVKGKNTTPLNNLTHTRPPPTNLNSDLPKRAVNLLAGVFKPSEIDGREGAIVRRGELGSAMFVITGGAALCYRESKTPTGAVFGAPRVINLSPVISGKVSGASVDQRGSQPFD